MATSERQCTTEVHDKLDQILKQAILTNGRLSRVEEEVFGDEKHRTPGVLADLRELKQIAYDARAVARAVKWGFPIFAAANVAILVEVVTR